MKENLSDHKGHILQTCSDCLLWTDTFRNGDVTGRYILQFSESCTSQHIKPGCNLDVDILSLLAARTGKMYPKHVEIFKKQLGCLNFPDDYHSYDGKTGQQLSKNLQRQRFNSHRVEILPCEMSYLSAIVFRSSLFLDRIHKIQCTW